MGRREYLVWSINWTTSLPEFESPGLWEVLVEAKSQLSTTGLLLGTRTELIRWMWDRESMQSCDRDLPE